VVSSFSDQDENILGLKLDYDGYLFWAVSNYGPNNNDNVFYDNLTHHLNVAGIGTGTGTEVPLIIGGDWNATICTLNSPDNIDILNIPSPPSNFRSLRIDKISTRCQLTDPFRALWPDKRDFSYIPRSGRNNRSRLDFF
jgi:hypothetical protein